MKAIVAKILKNFIDDKLSSFFGFILLILAIVLYSINKLDNEAFYSLLSVGVVLLGINHKDILTKKK